MSAPLTDTVPEVGRRIPEIMLSNVVLPLPDGPTMNSISPNFAENTTPFTAVTLASPSPKDFVRPFATIAFVVAGFAVATATEPPCECLPHAEPRLSIGLHPPTICTQPHRPKKHLMHDTNITVAGCSFL